MITKILTKLGDKLGLVRDNKNPDQTDGLSHLYLGIAVHLIASIIGYAILSYRGADNPYYILNVIWKLNMIVTAIMTVVLIYEEDSQERAMIKDDRTRKYHWSMNRYQDVLIYTVFGLMLNFGLWCLLWVI